MNMPTRAFLQNYKISISTLSPVHIGCGEDYEPTNYVIKDGALHHFDLASLMQIFQPEELKKIDNMASGKNPHEPFQQLMFSLKDRLIPSSTHQVFVSSSLENRYVERMNGKINNDNKLEFQRTAYNAHTNNPLLPGSAIKGAIRTAYLSQENNGVRHNFACDDKNNVRKNEGAKLEKKIMSGQFSSDWFSLFKVSDASWKDSKDLASPVIAFDANISKKLDKMKSGLKSDKICLMREYIPAMNYDAFEGGFSIQDIGQLIGKSFNYGDKKIETPNKQITLEELVENCNTFYKKIFSDEFKTLKSLGCLNANWEHLIADLLSHELGELLQEGKAILLRVGRHSGAEAVTLQGNRHIKILLKDNNVTHFDHATTLWLAADAYKQKTNLIPFGWLVAFVNPDHGDHRLMKISEKMKAYCSKLILQQNEVRESVASLRRELQEQQQKLMEREAIKQREKMEAEHAELAKQAARAAMSPEQQAIEALKDRKAKGEDKGSGPGCKLADDLRLLCEAAAAWDQTQKDILHGEALELLVHLGVDRKKNDKWKARLAALKA